MLFVRFFTDTDEPKNGFKAKLSIGYCGGTVRGYSGVVAFTNPINNDYNQNCSWHIAGPADNYLILRLIKPRINCINSSLIVYEEYMEDGILNGKELLLIQFYEIFCQYSFSDRNNGLLRISVHFCNHNSRQ